MNQVTRRRRASDDRPDRRSRGRGVYVPGIVTVAVIVLGFVLPAVLSPDLMGLVIEGGIQAVFAISIGLLIRFLGMTSLGHAAFYGGAAYAMTIATIQFGVSLNVAAVIAMGVCVALAVIIGAISVRVPGIGFALVTLGCAQAVFVFLTLTRFREITGSHDGLALDSGSFLWLSSIQLIGGDLWQIVWPVLVLSVLGTIVLGRSRYGILLLAIKDNEERVRFSGVRTFLPKLIAFTASGALAGVAGVLALVRNSFVSPVDADWFTTAYGVIAAMLGGIGSAIGPVVGAYLIVAVREVAGLGQLNLYLGVAFIVVIAFLPRGFMGIRLRPSRRPAAQSEQSEQENLS